MYNHLNDKNYLKLLENLFVYFYYNYKNTDIKNKGKHL